MHPPPLILFDIDGTLVTRISRSPSRKQRAFTAAVAHIYGVTGVNYMNHDIFGLTDRGILALVLSEHGVSPETISEREAAFIRELLDIYMDMAASAAPDYRPLPGVTALLDRLEGYRVGLATGNFERIARCKLEDAGLAHRFAFGGFGEDAVARSAIVKAAMTRAGAPRTSPGYLFGDTPHDIRAGHANDLRVAAVATGRFHREDLAGICRPGDCIFEDLSDLSAVTGFIGSAG